MLIFLFLDDLPNANKRVYVYFICYDFRADVEFVQFSCLSHDQFYMTIALFLLLFFANSGLFFLSFFLFSFFVKDSTLSVSEQNSANWFPRFIPLFLKLPHLGREKELPCRLKLQAALSFSLPSDPLARSHAISTVFSLNVKKKKT